ncbi:MAG TPA: type II secretion system protein [Verrucomicrobiae bacterium]|nr:type II secretion system protein [Verrucomicrobiae bacterium]
MNSESRNIFPLPHRVTIADRAFTLIELLVILAIVITLLAVAWPALSHTRNQAQDAIDIYNHRQLMAAAALYSADQNESLPGNGWGTTSDCWAHEGNIPVYNGTITAATFPAALSNQVQFCQRGQLFSYVRSPAIFKCPMDVTNEVYFQREILFSSYTWNGAVCAYGFLPDGVSLKITQFKPNSLLEWEFDEQTPFYVNDCSEYPDEGISSRHGSYATAGLVSGGTQRIPIKEWYSSLYAGQQAARGTTIPQSQRPNQAWCNPQVRSGLEN